MSSESIPDTFPCACCSQETEREYRSTEHYDRGRRYIVTNRHHAATYAIGHCCDSCTSRIKESAAAPRKAIPGIVGDKAFYGNSSAFSIPAHNSELRRYVAAVDAGRIDLGWNVRKPAKRKVSTPRPEVCAPGRMHPRMAAYLRAVERGAIPAPYSAKIDYAATGETVVIERGQTRCKPTAKELEILAAVEAAVSRTYRQPLPCAA